MTTSPCQNFSEQLSHQQNCLRTFDGRLLHLEGPLYAPVDGQLRHRVRTLLSRGERNIVVDLARVPKIDAAGVGELVRAYNMTLAANGVLRVTHATPWVYEVLERVGLSCLLSAEPTTV